MKIGLIVGSLRSESWNKKVAEVVKEVLPANVEAGFIDIKDVPFYNTDWDGDNPREEYTKVREEIKKYDAYIFFVPEYNRSYAPAIKNVIDVGSRDKDGNIWSGKPAAVYSASMGGFGGMAANHALRQTFIFVNLIVQQQPEVYLAKIQELFDENGQMVKGTKDFLQSSVESFVEFAKKIAE